jgi:putative transposase
MHENIDVRKGRHCVFMLHTHLVFVTKYRRNIFNKIILDDLKTIFESVCKDFNAELVEFDGEKDHVHLLINYPPKVSIAKLVNSLKGVSSRMLRKKSYPEIMRNLWGNMLWSPSYFAGSCGGAPLEIIKQYIQQQQTPL